VSATVEIGAIVLACCWTPTASAQQDLPRPLPVQAPAGQSPLVQPPSGQPLASQPPRDAVPVPDTNREQDEDEGRFEAPAKEVLFRLESESAFLQRVKLKKRIEQNNAEYTLPEETSITGVLQRRTFMPTQATVFPSYVVYHPLYFQQINAERYGWELGVFQPLVSTAQFYGDVLLLPYKVAANPPWTCDANVGYNLPGNPEPLRFLTVPFSWRGVAAEAGAAVGGAAIFP
jgi:hypothetical protein